MHRIKIHQGGVASLDVEAVVNSRYPEMKTYIPYGNPSSDSPDVGDVLVIPSSEKIIIEAIGPFWRGGDHQEEQKLATCYANAMEAAKQHSVRSIAFNPISCGPFGFPANRASRIAIQQIALSLRLNPFIESVTFCCADPVSTALYRNQIGK